jgi:hypothetical protein
MHARIQASLEMMVHLFLSKPHRIGVVESIVASLWTLHHTPKGTQLGVQGVGLTAEQITDMIWQAQEHFEPCIPEAEQQQKRALEMHVTDVLEVLAGLGCVHKHDGSQGCVAELEQVQLNHHRWRCFASG